MSRYVPDLPQVSREAIAVIVGALVAAWFFRQAPALGAYVRASLGPLGPGGDGGPPTPTNV